MGYLDDFYNKTIELKLRENVAAYEVKLRMLRNCR